VNLLLDKLMIVNGMCPGMGQKLSLIAAQEGARLAMCARTAAKLEEAARQINAIAPHSQVLQVPSDISGAAAAKWVMAGAYLELNGGNYKPL
jgi:short-subunit dehydrogenase